MGYLTSLLALLFRTVVLGFLGQLVPASASGLSPRARDPTALPFISSARAAPPSESHPISYRTQLNPDENQQRVDEHLESDEVGEALQAAEHHSETQAHHSASKSSNEQKVGIDKTILRKTPEKPVNFQIRRVFTTIQLGEFRHGIDSLKDIIQDCHSLVRMNHP